MTDIIELLTADHREVKAMLKTLTSDKAPDTSAETFQRLYTSIMAHAAFEENSVYPLLLQHSDSQDMAFEGYEEHHQFKRLLETLHELDGQEPTCAAKINVLSEDLNHHITEEENTIFPQLRKTVATRALEALGEEYQRIKAEASSHRASAAIP